MNTFLDWAKERGIATSASVQETTYAGHGLFSTSVISDNTPIVSIPQDLLLTSTKALQETPLFAQRILHTFSAGQDAQSFTAENERLILCLFLIYCKFFNNDTTWNHYMDILPTIDFFKDNHVLFNPDSVSGTSLETSIRTKLSSLKREFDRMTTDSQDHWLSDIQFDMYVWADCVFWSRVVGVGGDDTHYHALSEMALIPFFDFANHSLDNPNIRWQLTDKGIDIVTYPDTIIEQGQELLLSYGSKPNQELLFLHGFCIQDNPEPSRITIPLLPFLNPIEENCNLQKIYWLKQLGVKPALTLVHRSTESHDLMDAGWASDSIATMYLVVLDEDSEMEFSVSEEEDINLALGGHEIDSLETLEVKVKQMNMFLVIQLRVIVLLQEALEYHYSLVSTSSSDESSLARQISIYRSEEAAALKATIDHLTSQRDRLMQDPTVLSYLESA